ncbi:AraC family transcriptional regulator [Azospirillum sp.]|uniref:helix-turn-helix domain-containing protein n=1 Tax=Azospirillum sp. TaxID=34012 RepID=UPI002D312EDE|nr:AraC family transcriptional regulator [Azospirillum sp.]HYD67975.1 AraC family transcriptional regulator [Azospirillum sp.]
MIGDLRWRAWTGVIADVWNVACEHGARGEYISQAPRLVVVLDQVGDGGIHVTASPNQGGAVRSIGRQSMSYVPAGVRVWSRVENLRRLTHLDLHFDLTALEARLPDELDRDAVETPRLTFSDERLFGLARLIAAECVEPGGFHDLYGDSLISAMMVGLLRIAPKADRKRGQLPPRQLKRAIDYIEDNCGRNIRLQELAELTGLSQSYFCSAFKASTGMPPHKWQMRARIDRAKALLSRPDTTPAEAAAAAGFADQAHLTRVFRQVVGTTPAAWQRSRAA